MISGPRNVSTALMYSFGNRDDCSVVDEPFYAYYLKEHPDIYHPGREEVLESQSSNFTDVLNTVIYGSYPDPIVFFKNMAHHLDNSDWEFMKDMENLLLIRKPKELIASFARVIDDPTILDIAVKLEYEILQYLVKNDLSYRVLDSADLLSDPQNCLQDLCTNFGIPFSEKMLSWKAGERKEDGVWAKYWYANVHRSTGFAKKKLSDNDFPEHLYPLLEEAQYYYDKISEYK